MDLNFTREEIAFRDELRGFLAEHLPRELSDKVRSWAELSKADMERWHTILNARGWLATTWPKEHGGTGWGPVRRHIFEEECCLAYAPRIVPFGLNMLGAVLIEIRHSGAAGRISAAHSGWSRLVVSGLFRTGRGV